MINVLKIFFRTDYCFRIYAHFYDLLQAIFNILVSIFLILAHSEMQKRIFGTRCLIKKQIYKHRNLRKIMDVNSNLPIAIPIKDVYGKNINPNWSNSDQYFKALNMIWDQNLATNLRNHNEQKLISKNY